jgi:cytosine/adenosine deaminase-related metal-dependent hydrolase
MRTIIRGGWVVGFENDHHALVPNGVVVFEDDRILFVGREFEGTCDREIDATGKLICPGFIDTHVHSGHRATHRLISDAGRPEFFGQPFLEFTIPKEGTKVRGDKRFHDPDPDDIDDSDYFFALFTVAELLRNGTTTYLEIAGQVRIQEQLARATEELGIRAYLGTGYHSGRWVGGDGGHLKRVIDEPAGMKLFEIAKDYIRKIEGTCDGRIRGLLCPESADICSFEMIRDTRKVSDELGVPIQIHASYSVLEFTQIVHEYGLTPIEFLEKAGVLGPGTSIGHGNFIGENRLMNYSAGRDLEILAETGTSVAHCPVNLVRRARYLEWDRFQKAGINIALGTDTYPRDMIMQMRMASYFGKVISGSFLAGTAAEVFEAATLGGARAIQRDDLGRLAPGAKADILIIDTIGRNNLRWGPIKDPIKSLVECGISDDVETVFVDGIARMEDRRIDGVDMSEITQRAQSVAEDIWDNLQEWDPLGRTAEQMCPWSFPIAE